MVHTRSSPPSSNADPVESLPASKPRARWSDDDESKLILFLLDHHAQAGDSATFKDSVWRAAAEHLEQTCTIGGPKDLGACKRKWSKVANHSLIAC